MAATPKSGDTKSRIKATKKRGSWSTRAMENNINELLAVFAENDRNPDPNKRYPNATELGKLLGRERWAIYRMVDHMRDDLGMPVDNIKERGGYGFTEPIMGLPSLVYTKGESIGLCVSVLASAMYEHTPFARGAEAIASKMTAGFRKDMAVEFDTLAKHVSFHCTGMDAFIPPVNFEVVTPAVIDCIELEIDYVKPRDPRSRDKPRDAEPGLRRVEPVHMACVDFGWYLFAWDPARDEIRTFALRRIRGIRSTGRKLKRRKCDVKAELEQSFGPFINRPKKTVRLRFWGHAAQVIPEFIWNRRQKITPVADEPGSIDVTLVVAVNPRLIGWVCEWLGEVGVIEPAELRKAVRERAMKGVTDQDRFEEEFGGELRVEG